MEGQVLSVKPGVKFKDLQPQMVIACFVVYTIYAKYGYDSVITSGNDSSHSKNSLHYQGRALDFRTRHIVDAKNNPDLAKCNLLAREIRDSLGPDFDVLFENDHIHVEFDPKGK